MPVSRTNSCDTARAEEHDYLGLDRLLPSHGSDLFSRLRLQSYLTHFDLKKFSQPATDGFFVRRELWLLREHDAIDVCHPVAGLGDELHGSRQHFGRVAA